MEPLEALLEEEHDVLANFVLPEADAAHISDLINVEVSYGMPIGDAADLASQLAVMTAYLNQFPLKPYLFLMSRYGFEEGLKNNLLPSFLLNKVQWLTRVAKAAVREIADEVGRKHSVVIPDDAIDVYMLNLAGRILSGATHMLAPLPGIYLAKIHVWYESKTGGDAPKQTLLKPITPELPSLLQ